MVLMLALVGLTMAIIWAMPKLTSVIPAPLAGIGIVAGIVIIFGLDVPRVGDLASIQGGFPSFHNPFSGIEGAMGLTGDLLVPVNLETLKIILPFAVILAAIGLIESLLTLNLVGEITGKRGGASQECVAQGIANTVTGFFGGMGGCAMIGQSMINVKSGGRTRIAGIAAAMFLLIFIMFASPAIEQIPLAALVGVMFMVVIGTFAWNSLKIVSRVPRADAFVILLVTVVTVYYDLATAVVVGVIVSALVYAWGNATRISFSSHETADNTKIYQLRGPLFFGSAEGFSEMFNPEQDPGTVIVDFADSRVVDQSALQAIETTAGRYEAAGKRIQLRHLSPDCHQLLSKAGHLVVDSDDDPDYEVAVDYSVRTGILGGH
jgi:SulP family sulfate permease